MSGIEDFIGTMRSGDDSSIDQCSVANRKSTIANLRNKSHNRVIQDIEFLGKLE